MIQLFRNDNFTGGALTKDDSDSNLSNDDFNDTVSSVIVQDGVWTLFEDAGFQGRSITVASKGGPAGDGRYRDPNSLGGRNDFFSSIRRNA